MRIRIIGAGHIGRALARRAKAAGYDVMVSNSRGPASLAAIAEALQCEAGATDEAARYGDVAFIAVPYGQHPSIDPSSLTGKIVGDANNYYPQRDGRIEALDRHLATTSELVARHLRASKVVKAFNAILAADIETAARPPGAPDRRALPIAGDDPEAKRVMARLVDAFGFDAVDAGSLAASWRFERAKPAYCLPFDVAGLTAALAAAERDVELPHGSWRRAR